MLAGKATELACCCGQDDIIMRVLGTCGSHKMTCGILSRNESEKVVCTFGLDINNLLGEGEGCEFASCAIHHLAWSHR